MLEVEFVFYYQIWNDLTPKFIMKKQTSIFWLLDIILLILEWKYKGQFLKIKNIFQKKNILSCPMSHDEHDGPPSLQYHGRLQIF